MSRTRVLIVDDEPLARERIRALLHGESSAEVAGECGSGPEAIAAIRAAPPDVVFLDVQMPGCDGLQVVEQMPETDRPAIVFVTAHEHFAVDAFAVQAVDYLLKPFDRSRFLTALRRAQEHLRVRQAAEANGGADEAAATPRLPDRLAVKTDGRLVFVRFDDIVWIEAADNYVVLHLRDERLMLRETLSALEARLGATGFVRVNRSALVRTEQIRELQPTAHGDYVVVLRNGTKVALSRSLRGQLSTLLRGAS